jgi:hypothetical protein
LHLAPLHTVKPPLYRPFSRSLLARKAKDESRLPIFTLSPEMFCKRTPEKKEDLKREAQKKRGRRYSALYDLLDLKVVAQRDETLDITWNFGNRQVRLGEEPPTIRRAVTGEGFEEDLEKVSDRRA